MRHCVALTHTADPRSTHVDQAQGCDTVITCGGVQSNHCRATAVAARECGMASYLVQYSKDPQADPGLEGMRLRKLSSVGTEGVWFTQCAVLRTEGVRITQFPVIQQLCCSAGTQKTDCPIRIMHMHTSR